MSRVASKIDATKPDEEQPYASERGLTTGYVATSDKGQARPMLFLITSGISLVAAIIIGIAITITNLRSGELSDSKRELANTALLVAKHIDRQIEELENVQDDIVEQMLSMEISSHDDFDRKMSSGDVSLGLKHRISGFSHIDTIILIDSDGKVINASNGLQSHGLNFADRDYFNVLKSDPQKTRLISEPVRGRIGGDWKIIVARKVGAPDGKFLGLIIGSIQLNVFEDYFRSIMLGEGGFVGLQRNDGMVLARHPRIESAIGHTYKGAIDALGKDDHGTIILAGKMEGKKIILASQRLSHYQLIVNVGMDSAVALAGWWKQTIALMSLGLFTALLIAAMVFMIARQMLRGKKNFQQEIEEQKRQLNTAMNNMTQGLVMFNSVGELVVCNDRYRQIYDLPPSLAKPGCPVIDLLKCRAERGTFSGNPDEYVRSLLIELAQGKATKQDVELADGRIISVVNKPMQSGGWVATHEDITEAKHRESSFRLLFKSNPVPMWVYDVESLRFLAVNDAAVRHYGYSAEQFSQMTVMDIRPLEERERIIKFLRVAGEVHDGEESWRHQKSDKTIIDVVIYSRVLNYEGRSAALVASIDITDRKRGEDELRRTKRFIDAVIEHVPLPIIVKDVSGLKADARGSRFTLFNRAYEELTGELRTQMIGKTVHQVFPKERADLITQSDSKTLQSDQAVLTSEHPIATIHNGTRLVVAKKTVIRDENDKPQYLLTVVDDVTDRRRADARIAHLAHYDALTDLPNRVTFNNAMSAALERAALTGKQLSILSVDLDRFKEVNDTYGHSVGDALLREVARRLYVAAGETFLARVGGDEFALIVTDGPQPATASALAECLQAVFENDIEVEGRQLKLGLCIGGAVFPTDGPDAKTLMVNADAALYRAKAEARGSVQFYQSEMGARLREHHALQNDLRLAVDRGELFLHYQPQVRMTGEFTGFEALVRWQCQNRGMVSPGTFIPLAEESSLILPIGKWVLREACREAASWSQPLSIAVNISPVQFRHGDLPSLVHSILLETGLAPARLELEITEGVFIDDFSRAVSILRRLKSLGVQIALDDFGTGYSSLSYLHSFAFDKIKIDRAFIGDLDHNRHSMAITRAVIGLGHSLDVPVLAEGVETDAQHAFLVQEGCDEVQGYLTGRPLPIADYARFVGRHEIIQSEYAIAG